MLTTRIIFAVNSVRFPVGLTICDGINEINSRFFLWYVKKNMFMKRLMWLMSKTQGVVDLLEQEQSPIAMFLLLWQLINISMNWKNWKAKPSHKLFSTYGMQYSTCTGSLITPSYVLTAAHCIHYVMEERVKGLIQEKFC